MNNRFCRMGNAMVGAFMLLALSGTAVSCSENYDLDDKNPTFLGGSIYQELKDRKNFTTTLRLIDDLNYADVMSKTGSKTVFAAPDEAYVEFFKNNPWGVKSYDELTLSQKRLLFNSAQLNNAYVVEMLSNGESGQKNLCLRQRNSLAVTDTVPFWHWSMLPQNFSQIEGEQKYWDRFRKNQKSIYMATDATQAMMTHFLDGHMKQLSIKKDDVAFVLNDKAGWPETESRAYIYDAKITQQDIVCLNGYVHVLDKVLLQPNTMAEELRKNSDTQLFSHILDRFSAPYYNATLTDNFKANYSVDVDSVFERRYFATNTKSGRVTTGPDERPIQGDYPYLNYDPGWSAYAATSTEGSEKNMAAMFVPNDEALSAYFISGGGKVLMDRYATEKPVTEENVMRNLDQIPLPIVQALVNNLMKASFNESVPSKYLTVMNDARDQMFPPTEANYATLEAYKSNFTKTLLANNGVVYVMNKVISPADYASVIAPALYSNDAQVMRTVVRADDSYIQGSSYNSAPLKQYYSTYLKAMQSRFSFFIPMDEGLSTYGYIDPVQLGTGNRSNYQYFTFKFESGAWPADNAPRVAVRSDAFRLDIDKGQRPGVDAKNSTRNSLGAARLDSEWGQVKRKLLIEMVDQHIVVHPNDDKTGVRGVRKYFLSRSGAPVVVKNDLKDIGMEVHGGMQEQYAGTPLAWTSTVREFYDQSLEKNGYGNGFTYLLDRPMQPATQSTYKVIKENPDASKFLELCEGMSEELLQKAGFRDSLIDNKLDSEGKEWAKIYNRYFFFMNSGVKGSYITFPGDKVVRFFNNYRYTVYLPTNDAIEVELANGLPTWTQINKFLDDNLRPVPDLLGDKSNQAEVDAAKNANAAVKLEAKAMVTLLVNFLRYHFQDESVFVDNVSDKQEYMTAAVNEETSTYMPVIVTQVYGGLSVKDGAGRTANVTNVHNILVRDAVLDVPTSASSLRTIASSSYAVVHQIDKALRFDKAAQGSQGYRSFWASPKKAKAFLAKYGIKA